MSVLMPKYINIRVKCPKTFYEYAKSVFRRFLCIRVKCPKTFYEYAKSVFRRFLCILVSPYMLVVCIKNTYDKTLIHTSRH